MLRRPVARTGMLLLVLSLASAISAPATRAQPPDNKLFLPQIQVPAIATIEFAPDVDRASSEPTNPTDTFAVGIDLLFVAWHLQGLQGRQYRLDLTYADGETLAGSPRVAGSNSFRDWSAYCITTAATCNTGRIPLPTGTYIARLFIDGQLFSERTAVIQ